MQQPRFANARSVRNALERARLRQATRIVSRGGKLSKADLMCLETEDILKSRVFSDTEAEGATGDGQPDGQPAHEAQQPQQATA